MNKKLKELVDIIQTLFFPLTKNHASHKKYFVNKECSIQISGKYVSLTRGTWMWNHIEIHTSDGKSSLVQVYSDYDFSDIDQLIIDVMNLYQNGISKETLKDQLLKQKQEIEKKLENLENEQ